MVTVGFLGAETPKGQELIKLLQNHQDVNIYDLAQTDENMVILGSDVIFSCLANGNAERVGDVCYSNNKLFIDLSADFRLANESEHNEWYGDNFGKPYLHNEAGFGIPEIFEEAIAQAKLVTVPSANATAVILGLYVSLKRQLVETDNIVIDIKCGYSNYNSAEHKAYSPINLGNDDTVPELEQILSYAAGKKVKVTQSQTLIPIERGMLVTMYTRLKLGINLDKIREEHLNFYYGKEYMRIKEKGYISQIEDVVGTNYCDISWHYDKRTGVLLTFVAMDDLIKGAAGQAVQIMNLMSEIKKKNEG